MNDQKMDHFKFRSQNYPNSSSTTSSSSSSEYRKNSLTKRSTLSTDPQSMAARERRHRISDRFKILRGMVPGGEKMDTVSMLDEAINYVKFLKTQIWLHQNMFLFFNENETTYSPAEVGEFGPILFADDYAPVTETYSQGMMPRTLMDPDYSPMWFGSVDNEQEETMHRRGFSQ